MREFRKKKKKKGKKNGLWEVNMETGRPVRKLMVPRNQMIEASVAGGNGDEDRKRVWTAPQS